MYIYTIMHLGAKGIKKSRLKESRSSSLSCIFHGHPNTLRHTLELVGKHWHVLTTQSCSVAHRMCDAPSTRFVVLCAITIRKNRWNIKSQFATPSRNNSKLSTPRRFCVSGLGEYKNEVDTSTQVFYNHHCVWSWVQIVRAVSVLDRCLKSDFITKLAVSESKLPEVCVHATWTALPQSATTSTSARRRTSSTRTRTCTNTHTHMHAHTHTHSHTHTHTHTHCRRDADYDQQQ